jgi:hypothetical protein
MKKKLSVLFALFALVSAIAGTAPAIGSSYTVKLLRASVLKEVVLKQGEYRLTSAKRPPPWSTAKRESRSQ